MIDDTSQRDATELDDEAERLAEALLGLFPEPADSGLADDAEVDDETSSITAGLFDSPRVTVSAAAVDEVDPLAGASTDPVIVSRSTESPVTTVTDTGAEVGRGTVDPPAGLFGETREASSPSFTGVFRADDVDDDDVERANPPSVLFRPDDDDEDDDGLTPLVAAPIFGESARQSPSVEFIPPPRVDESEATRRRAMVIGGGVLGLLLFVALIGLLISSFTGGGDVVETDTVVSTPLTTATTTAPTTDAPTTEAPTTTAAATTEAPATTAESTTIPSTTVAPATTAAPATQRPATTAAPTTAAPTTAAPTTAAPTTAAPTTAAPTTAAPTTAPAPTWSIDEG